MKNMKKNSYTREVVLIEYIQHVIFIYCLYCENHSKKERLFDMSKSKY